MTGPEEILLVIGAICLLVYLFAKETKFWEKDKKEAAINEYRAKVLKKYKEINK